MVMILRTVMPLGCGCARVRSVGRQGCRPRWPSTAGWVVVGQVVDPPPCRRHSRRCTSRRTGRSGCGSRRLLPRVAALLRDDLARPHLYVAVLLDEQPLRLLGQARHGAAVLYVVLALL